MRALASVLACTRRGASSGRLAYGPLNGLRTVQLKDENPGGMTRDHTL